MCVATKMEIDGKYCKLITLQYRNENVPEDTPFNTYEFLSYFQQRELPNA